MRLLLILSGLFLGLSDPLFQLHELLWEGLLNVRKLSTHLSQPLVKVLLAFQLVLILLVQSVEFLLVALLQLGKLLVLLLDALFLLFDEVLLASDGPLHLSTLLVLLVFVGLHMRLQVLLDLLNIVDLSLLLLEHVLCLLQFLVLVAQLVDLSFELVRLLLFDHLDVPVCNLLNLGEAAVREAVTLQSDFGQCRVLVQGFKHHGFDLLGEEVVAKADLTDMLVALKCINDVDKASIVQTARAEIKLLQLGGSVTIASDHSCKVFEDLVLKEVFVADKRLQVCVRQGFAEDAEAGRTDLIQTNVELFELGRIAQCLS